MLDVHLMEVMGPLLPIPGRTTCNNTTPVIVEVETCEQVDLDVETTEECILAVTALDE